MSKILIASFILVATLVGFSIQEFNVKSPEILEPNFLDMMLNSRSSPEVTMQCFQNYNSNLEKVSLKYEKELNGCNETAANATKAVDQEVDPNVTAVQESQKNICTGFSKCSSLNSGAYDFFDCSNEAVSTAIQFH